jgi:phosphoglycolate phosphatase-like HAD superfamily hydrolase
MIRVIHAVLFDMDGVLLESYEAWYLLLNAACRDLGYPEVSRDRYACIWGQGVDADAAGIFLRHSVGEIEEYYNANFRRYAGAIRVHPEATETFGRLRERRIRTAVVTNTPAPMAREILGAAGIAPDALVGGTDTPKPKPAPDPVLRACEILAVTADRAIFVGDSRYDREAAGAARVPFVGFGIEGDRRVGSLLEILALL